MLNLHLLHLQYICEIARTRSWREAAKRLHRTQPALSQAVHELEKRLGLELFEPQGRVQKFTPWGLEFLKFSKHILDEFNEFEARLTAARRGETGILRVGAIDAVCLYMLPKPIKIFQRQRQRVQLHLTVGHSALLLEKLLAHEIDLAFVVGPVTDKSLHTQVIQQEPLYIVRPQQKKSLRKARWLLYPQHSHTRQHIDKALLQQDIVPSVVLESSQPQILAQMVALGFGWSILPKPVWRHMTQIKQVGRQPLVHRQIVAVKRITKTADARLDYLLQLVSSHMLR